LAYAKKDFYYGFIDSNGNQISHRLKQDIIDGYVVIENVREMIKDGNINSAYSLIKTFKEQNKLIVLESEIILLYSELLLKKRSKRFILEASKLLEDSINSSLIHEEDLPKAYMLLVDLNLESNKVTDARFFAENIVNNFNDPITKAYGKIYLAKTYSRTRSYTKAINILYEILAKTNDILIATIVADELFDVYIKNNNKEKAYELINKVLEKNIDYYADNSYLAMQKINKLMSADMPEFAVKILLELINKVLEKNIDYYADNSYLAMQKINKLMSADMPEFAVKILLELINRTKKPQIIEEFKYRLANIYMGMFEGSNYFLFKAKELYKDIINDYPSGDYSNKSKVFLDEILMRERKLEPEVVASKYKNSSSMKQKVLMQELLNEMQNENYTQILKSKKIYRKISHSIAKRFGYESVNEVFDITHVLLVEQYLNEGQCILLNKALQDVSRKTLLGLIQNKETSQKFFDCLIEVPFEKGYLMTKDAFYNSRDADVYYNLERMAYSLDLIDEAFRFSLKLDMVNDKDVLSKEFLSRFLVYSAKNDLIEMDRFFKYTLNNEKFIIDNENDPKIIDLYYQYYLYLLKKDRGIKAQEILNKLNEKQIEFKAKIYSPFVELELIKIDKENKNFEGAINTLEEFLKSTRRIKQDDLAHVYYELSKLYSQNENETKYDEVVSKCKAIQTSSENFYKKMCDEL